MYGRPSARKLVFYPCSPRFACSVLAAAIYALGDTVPFFSPSVLNKAREMTRRLYSGWRQAAAQRRGGDVRFAAELTRSHGVRTWSSCCASDGLFSLLSHDEDTCVVWFRDYSLATATASAALVRFFGRKILRLKSSLPGEAAFRGGAFLHMEDQHDMIAGDTVTSVAVWKGIPLPFTMPTLCAGVDGTLVRWRISNSGEIDDISQEKREFPYSFIQRWGLPPNTEFVRLPLAIAQPSRETPGTKAST